MIKANKSNMSKMVKTKLKLKGKGKGKGKGKPFK